MEQYDEELEVFWEVNFFDLVNGELSDFFGNTDKEEQIEILIKKAFKKGYDSVEVTKVTRETKRYHK